MAISRLQGPPVISGLAGEVAAPATLGAEEFEGPLASADKAIWLFIVFTPLLWLTGFLLPLALLLVAWLLFRQPFSAYLTDRVVLAWWLLGLAQVFSVFLNWFDSSQPFSFLLRNLVSFSTTGWFLLGAALAAGKYSRLDGKKLVRSAVVLGLYFIIFAGICGLMYFVLKFDQERLEIPSFPLGLFLDPSYATVSFYFYLRFYAFEEFFGRTLPRLVLFYPWPLCLSFAGIGAFFMSIQEKNRFWRYLGLTGALVAIVGSMGRTGLIAFSGSLLVYSWGKLSRSQKWISVPLLAILAIIFVLANAPERLASGMAKEIELSRIGSTDARRLVYQETWEAFRRSPVIGYGWQGPPISEEIPMPLGSHSTVLGLLYTGGVVTFAFFCLAVALTLFSLFKQAARGDARHLSALCIFLALLVFSLTEGINYFVVSTLLLFFWLGWALSPESLALAGPARAWGQEEKPWPLSVHDERLGGEIEWKDFS